MADKYMAQEIASWHRQPGRVDGIGFAKFADTGRVTPKLWRNIEQVEQIAAEPDLNGEPDTGVLNEMTRLRAELTALGYAPPAKD